MLDNLFDHFPTLVYTDDYHEFSNMETFLDTIFPASGLRIKELGFDRDNGKYVGVVYGEGWERAKADAKVENMITHLEEQEDEH